jgi:hypothetical protein
MTPREIEKLIYRQFVEAGVPLTTHDVYERIGGTLLKVEILEHMMQMSGKIDIVDRNYDNTVPITLEMAWEKAVCESDTVHDDISAITALAVRDNYVMCRRPSAIPFVMTVKKWKAMMK